MAKTPSEIQRQKALDAAPSGGIRQTDGALLGSRFECRS